MMSFDALDFFQAQKHAERIAQRALEESRAALEKVQNRAEELHTVLATKQRSLDEFTKRLVDSSSAHPFVERLTLLSNQLSVAQSLESKALDSLKSIDPEKLPFSKVQDENERIVESHIKAQAEVEAGKLVAREGNASLSMISDEINKLDSSSIELDTALKIEQAAYSEETHRLNTMLREVNQLKNRIQTIREEIVEVGRTSDLEYQSRVAARIIGLQDEFSSAEKQAHEDRQREASELESVLKPCLEKEAAIAAQLNLLTIMEKDHAALANERAAFDDTCDMQMANTRAEIAELYEQLEVMKRSQKSPDELWEVQARHEDERFLAESLVLLEPPRSRIIALQKQIAGAEAEFDQSTRDAYTELQSLDSISENLSLLLVNTNDN